MSKLSKILPVFIVSMFATAGAVQAQQPKSSDTDKIPRTAPSSPATKQPGADANRPLGETDAAASGPMKKKMNGDKMKSGTGSSGAAGPDTQPARANNIPPAQTGNAR